MLKMNNPKKKINRKNLSIKDWIQTIVLQIWKKIKKKNRNDKNVINDR